MTDESLVLWGPTAFEEQALRGMLLISEEGARKDLKDMLNSLKSLVVRCSTFKLIPLLSEEK